MIINNADKLKTHGASVIDAASSSQIILEADLVLGASLRKSSSAETLLKLHDGARFIVAGSFKVFYGSSIEIFQNAELRVGKGYINSGTVIACAKSISIGENCAIARGVYIYDSDHHRIVDDTGAQLNLPSPVVIGNHVWIGVGAIILKGVSIGDGAIIAAGAVVTHDIPPNCMAAGVPARIIRENVIWE